MPHFVAALHSVRTLPTALPASCLHGRVPMRTRHDCVHGVGACHISFGGVLRGAVDSRSLQRVLVAYRWTATSVYRLDGRWLAVTGTRLRPLRVIRMRLCWAAHAPQYCLVVCVSRCHSRCPSCCRSGWRWTPSRPRATAIAVGSCIFLRGRSSSSICGKSTTWLDSSGVVASLGKLAKRPVHRSMLLRAAGSQRPSPALTGSGIGPW